MILCFRNDDRIGSELIDSFDFVWIQRWCGIIYRHVVPWNFSAFLIFGEKRQKTWIAAVLCSRFGVFSFWDRRINLRCIKCIRVSRNGLSLTDVGKSEGSSIHCSHTLIKSRKQMLELAEPCCLSSARLNISSTWAAHR